MGIYIKDMTMPSECRECSLWEYRQRIGTTWCVPTKILLAENYMPIPFDGRPEWCPLVEIKTPHGRLIDADELIDDLRHDVAIDQDMLDYEELSELNRIHTQGDKDIKQNAIDLLEHSKAVIEAEDEG